MIRERLLAALGFAAPLLSGCTMNQDLGTSAGASTEDEPAGVQLLELGGRHACAVIEGGALKCWGRNDYGQVGLAPDEGGDCDGTPCKADHPWTLVDAAQPKALVLGSRHSCSLSSSGEVECWGANAFGQLGRGIFDLDPHAAPQRVLDVPVMTEISAGAHHTCARTESGEAVCWGLGAFGQLGVDPGALDPCPTPTDLAEEWGLSEVACSDRAIPFDVGAPILEIVAGGFSTCARTAVGWQCVGRNDLGQLGRGNSSEFEAEPAPPSDLNDVVHVALSDLHSCFTESSGTAWCSGSPSLGRLGVGSLAGNDCLGGECFPEPVPVQNLDNVEATALGIDFTCTLLDDESTRCFGTDAQGQLGNSQGEVETCSLGPDEVSCSLTPVEPYQLTKTARLYAGEDFACSLSTEGRVLCWGDNRMGQLSQGPAVDMAPFPSDAYGLDP